MRRSSLRCNFRESQERLRHARRSPARFHKIVLPFLDPVPEKRRERRYQESQISRLKEFGR
jgi:hypothetical protein